MIKIEKVGEKNIGGIIFPIYALYLGEILIDEGEKIEFIYLGKKVIAYLKESVNDFFRKTFTVRLIDIAEPVNLELFSFTESQAGEWKVEGWKLKRNKITLFFKNNFHPRKSKIVLLTNIREREKRIVEMMPED